MNKIILIFLCVLGISARSQDTAAIVKKATVIKAPEEEMLSAISDAELFIKDPKHAASLYKSFFIIGPVLWREIENKKEFMEMEAGDVTLKIPKLNRAGKVIGETNAHGRMIQDMNSFVTFCEYIHKNYNLSNAKIVDENNKDQFIFWLYFAKIEEPIVTIENRKARLMMKFIKGKLFFIELTSL